MSGFTSLGFSKSGFSCCSHFNLCEMGKGECFYQTIDPEVKNYCACYQRARSQEKAVAVETPRYVFANREHRLIGKCLTNTTNNKVGELYLLGPTKLNKGTHFYVYTLEGKFLGCLEVAQFEIMEKLDSSTVPQKYKKEMLPTETKKELDFEQLSLF